MHQWETTMHATLHLDDGSTFSGYLFGATKSIVGEIVFQTGMVGYVESLTDPSYADQLLVLTYPMIGNYGVPEDTGRDEFGLSKFESDRVWPAALIVDRLCPDGEESHWQSMQSLSQWLRKAGVPGLAGIDVRQLTKKIREQGTMNAKIVIETDDVAAFPFKDIYATNLVDVVSRKEPTIHGTGERTILAVDCGLKNNQLRCLLKRGLKVKVVPWTYPIDEEKGIDGVFLSNGPGDPEKCAPLVERIAKLMARADCPPLFGICLGHQLMSRAAGATTYKLKYGNRGHNQPCTHSGTGRCFITSQNHGFAVEASTLPAGWRVLFTNENDQTNEGIVHESKPYFSVQFHPEHTAGPTDCEFLFDIFVDAIERAKRKETFNVDTMINERLAFTCGYEVKEQKKVLVIGSGGLTIGQAGEFDYSGAQALKALREEGIRTVLINPNVATVQTSKGFADFTYFLPITKEYVTDVIKKERPTGVLCTFGGQTALNCAIDLYKDGIFDKYNVQVLGTPIPTIMNTEDREKFNAEINSIGERVAPSQAATNMEGAIQAAEQLGYPVLVRAAFALGGLGSGFAANRAELIDIVKVSLAHSDQVLVDKSLKGWKEVEYEVVRDAYDNCVTVCNMENVDPLGIHTGESVVVAPSQTLTDYEYNMLRTCAIKVVRHLGVIGECNIQYALDPYSHEFFIIEVNARLSRSSALASKATGYPLAYVAAKLALGQHLPVIRNSVTGVTTACFEPSLDYCVVKIPRWDLSKFARVQTQIGSSMKSVGEVMGIGRSFEEAFQKALRMVSDSADGFSPKVFPRTPTDNDLSCPTDKRMFALARGLFYGDFDVAKAHDLTKIDKWFLHRMQNIVDIAHKIRKEAEKVTVDKVKKLSASLLWEAKRAGFSDRQIAKFCKSNEWEVREYRQSLNVRPCVKQIDTVAGEWPAQTNYLYMTYNGAENDVEFNIKNAVIVLGSGVYRIGSSVEFDASCVGCVKELKALGYTTIMINCNPETVSTDYDMCDRLYFEEISYESVIDVYQRENPKGLILAFGGQAPNNIALSLSKANIKSYEWNGKVNIFGTHPRDIDRAEDRFKFSRELEKLKIEQPQWKKVEDIDAAKEFCNTVGYPCLIRPSYVLSGAAMKVVTCEEDLAKFLAEAAVVAKEHPVVISKFISEAKEIDVDAVASEGKLLAMAVSEHVENAGIHSGDATLVTPPQDLNKVTMDLIRDISVRIAKSFNVSGPFNMQLIAKNNELKVIECNLRVSRSFPFVSKSLGFDFIALATRAMMGADNTALRQKLKWVDLQERKQERVGVKVPQFSFSRLAGAEVILGVEMASTGEVACFGRTRHEAYLKALLSTGFVVPKKNIFLCIGGYTAKTEMLKSIEGLAASGYQLYASAGTAEFCMSKGIKVQPVEWPFEEGEGDASGSISFFTNKDFHLVINLSVRGSGTFRVSAYRTDGYRTRRMAIDNGIPLITDIKCAKIFCEALRIVGARPAVNNLTDCLSSRTLKRLPGLVDVHVHVREPGATHKEDWETCTRAALAGGVTTILAMPNTNPACVDEETLNMVEKLASSKAVVDYGIYLGATPLNVEECARLADRSSGLKMYLNETFSTLKMDSITDWIKHLASFPTTRPVVAHSERQTLLAILGAAQIVGRSVHICHVSTKDEIECIRMAKERGVPVTCEVCPHHLFLTQDDIIEGVREVRPRLGTQEDVDALWANIDYIDCFATDHAPHTSEEKHSEKPPPGFPGVEYMVPLLLTAVSEGKMTMKQLEDRLHYNPRRIFGIPAQPDTYVEVDTAAEWSIPATGGFSRAAWTPFAGKKIRGRVVNVVIRGEEAYVDGEIVAKPGMGRNIRGTVEGRAMAAGAADVGGLAAGDAALLPSVESPVKKSNGKKERLDSAESAAVAAAAAAAGSKSRAESDTSSPLATPPRAHSPSGGEEAESRFAGASVVAVGDLTKAMVHRVLDLADRFRIDLERGHLLDHVARGCVLASMFYEVSTRTSASFETAMLRLGGTVTSMTASTSSVQKGETLEDSVRIMAGYADAVVIRHPEKGAAARAAAATRVPVISGGDGTGEHPTQALLDLYTIRQELSTVNGLTIALVGDLKNGRTVHSLAKLLCVYKDITLHYVSPTEQLQMPQAVVDYVTANSSFTQKHFSSLSEGIQGVDVVYVTRLQKERFENPEEYEKLKGSYVLTAELLDAAAAPDDGDEPSRILHPHRQLPIVLHPLPRVDEISKELDHDDRAAYFRQARNGMFVRMAILALVLGRAPQDQ
ncbi:hypothetical protein PFISCL1PPCAC_18500 [Pristionchus fissidentatus]|uniref:Dihydroorotase n=1 Tax=Pristionchus fissidentatus TaxID=1538716 RepID=A0AAV5W905_9BILA|nr:hypothetical protein PFISCL1PPCAC_18500 [Pristionchus fissidentatus]